MFFTDCRTNFYQYFSQTLNNISVGNAPADNERCIISKKNEKLPCKTDIEKLLLSHPAITATF